MNKKEQQHIKDLISQIDTDKVSSNFTDKIMKDVSLLVGDDSLKDATLTSLLQKSIIEEPSIEFVATTLQKIETKNEKMYKPIISKKGWVIIFSVTLILTLITIFSSKPTEGAYVLNEISPYLDVAKSKLTGLFRIITIPPLFLISILCLGTLLMFDAMLKRKYSIN